MRKKGSFYIGTCGWHYEHWKGAFYPEDCDNKDFLSLYRAKFSTAEINNSFYALPQKSTLSNWKKTVGSEFVFAVKASRYITHMKKLKDPKESAAKFFDVIDGLKTIAEVVLFQLPPRWKANPRRLESFIEELPKGYRYAFEFRDESWFTADVYDILSRHNAGFCIYELAGRSSPEKVTADFIYVRLHGPGENAYQGNYSKAQLRRWAKQIAQWTGQGKDVYFYFDNDQDGYAPQNALALIELIGS
jgi:uncharacterized protein YecE (DUF72 family)